MPPLSPLQTNIIIHHHLSGCQGFSISLVMDNWNYRVRRRNPSFSSSLLDQIYRSIDQTPTSEEESGSPKKVHQNVEKLVLSTRASRRKSEYYDNEIEAYYLQSFRFDSCSTSSDSASFWTSSCSADSKVSTTKSKLAIRTSFTPQITQQIHQQEDEKIYVSHRQLKSECGGFAKAKSKSLKTNGDLKKPKAQPISPGSKLASFLNSLFTSPGNAKKAKIQQADDVRKCNAASTCSSASRSCFSKTPPSSRVKSSDGAKRSVRFSPLMSVIVDGDHQTKHDERRNSICGGEETRGKNERAREVLRNYSRKLNECLKMDEDEDDCSSCASSDLFELHNLDSVMGRERYCEELPVYETTSVNTNRAIANGLIV